MGPPASDAKFIVSPNGREFSVTLPPEFGKFPTVDLFRVLSQLFLYFAVLVAFVQK
jgi:hypothetical protein